MLFIVIVTTQIYKYYGDDSIGSFSNAYYYIILIDVLFFAVGGFCLTYKQLKKRSEQRKQILEARKAQSKPATKPVAKPATESVSQQTAPKPAPTRLQKPSVPGSASQPQSIQSIYLYENAHPLVIIRCVVGIIMMTGSLASIPFLVEIVPEDYILAYATAATVLFWSGLLILGAARSHAKLQKTSGFVVTLDDLLYYLSIDPIVYQDKRIPFTRLGRFIYNTKKMQQVSEAERAQEEFLNSKDAKEEIEECLNGNQVRGLFRIARMDAPHIMRRNTSNIHVKYWNEKLSRVEKITLFKNNKGIQQILSTINKLDQKIDYKEFEKSLHKQ
ncbi:hypothetical protein acsn021_13980 [Anaerocolumna cellulosilytica]|uniref:Uncharacterized protein n=1 Tax=Anaerocolumna cellulosilytica TaxID=433286 RepID=A0A6S6QXP2_9FIRM|nr:hypothetical protein [Anaerocolumna cellulosilytica]MBB5195586.1 general stress protein CsbA [Anaerocolumna cellulosilytica]BCJ93829.1 hypothetical protein acsn021_13980 [Anaerocolumna cellulosilytica]